MSDAQDEINARLRADGRRHDLGPLLMPEESGRTYGRPTEALRSGALGVIRSKRLSNAEINARLREALWTHDPGPFDISPNE